MPTRLSSLHLALLFPSLGALVVGLWVITTGPGPLPPTIAFQKPTAAVLDQRGRLYVVDVGGTRLTALGRDGTYRWSKSASADDRGFSVIHGLAVDTDDRLYLVDSARNRVARLSSRGEFDRVYTPPPTGRLLAFDAFDSGWLVSDHRLYLEVRRLGTEASSVIELPPVTPPALTAVGPQGEVSWVDAAGKLWTLKDRAWGRLELPRVSRISGLRYLADGRLLVLDHPSQTWFTWKEGHLEAVLSPLPSQATWSPLGFLAPDGTLVVTQPFADRVSLNRLGRTVVEGASVGKWTRGVQAASWVMVALGVSGVLGALILVVRALARRPLDLQVVQMALLVPLVVAFVTWAYGDLVRQGAAREDEARLGALESVVAALTPELEAHPEDFEALAAMGAQAGALGYVSLIEPARVGYRVVQAFPYAWIKGFETGLAPGAVELAPGQTHAAVYNGLWSRRHAAFGRLGNGRFVEVGLESSLVPTDSSGTLGYLWGALSAVLVLMVGAYSLAAVAPRYTVGRALLAPFPQGLSQPSPSRGVVVALGWTAEPRPGARPRWVRQVPELIARCRRAGARVVALNSRGASFVVHANVAQALDIARSLGSLAPRCLVLVEGPWDYRSETLVDRRDLVVTGDAIDTAWSLAQGEVGALGGLLLVGQATEGLDLPWRGVDPQGPVVQLLDPTRPEDRAALDYVAPHNEAFRAWGEGRLDDARRGFQFLAGRLPDDDVVAQLLARVTS